MPSKCTFEKRISPMHNLETVHLTHLSKGSEGIHLFTF